MSLNSPIEARPSEGRFGNLPGWVINLAIFGVVAVAVAPFSGAIWAELKTISPHLPDMALWAKVSPVIRIHLFTAVGALALGGVLMVVRKGRTVHRVAGWVWVSLVATVAGSSIFITQLNHGKWSLIHLLTAWTLLILPIAVIAAKRHKVVAHRKTMMGLFYGGFAINLIIAFMPGRLLWNLFF
jgi:uncharacterized membrane protein